MGILNKAVVRVMRGLEAKKSRDTTRRLFNREWTYQENTRREIVHKERIVQHYKKSSQRDNTLITRQCLYTQRFKNKEANKYRQPKATDRFSRIKKQISKGSLKLQIVFLY